jgi:chromosome segregation protein
VVEGRQRVEQRLQQLREQTAQWGTRREDAQAELETLAEQAAMAEDQSMTLAAQVEDQAMALPDLEEALRKPPKTTPTPNAPAWCRCSSKFRCWPLSSAT